MEPISRDLLTFLLNSLWQIPLVTAVAMLACWLMRSGPASHRHAVWVAALVASVLLPLSSVGTRKETPRLEIPQSIGATPGAALPVFRPQSPARSTPPAENRTVPFAQSTAMVVIAAYLAFLLFRSGRLALAWIATVRLRRAGASCALRPLIESVWTRCRESLGLKRVELLSSATLSSPVTAGAWRKTIIVPDSLLEETSEDVLTTAIGHEMAHIARRDFALNLLYELLYLPVSFHPAAWLIARGIRETRELACDELVTRRLLDPGVYARSLVRIAETAISTPRPDYALGVFDGDILEERIRRLVNRRGASLKRARLLLATALSALAVCAIVASGLALTARAQSGAYAEMKAAESAYNQGDFKTAIQRFENAVRLDPTNIKAKLFLASTLIREFFQQGGQPDSPILTSARAQYQDVLAHEPRNRDAIHGLIAVDSNARRLNEAHEWARKLIELDPNDKTGYYTVGVLSWAMVFPEYIRAKQESGSKIEDPLIPDANVRKALRDKHMPRIEEGMRMMQTALKLDPEYDDAMAYTNLLYRLAAGIVDNPGDSPGLMAKADEWVQKALDTKRRRPKGQQATGSRIDVDGPPPPPTNERSLRAAPPPPPPPPPPPREIAEGQLASASPPPMPRNGVEQPGTFWQVIGHTSMPVKTLFRTLADKGFPARMLTLRPDNEVRVMVGPYFDKPSLEQAKSALETAGFQPLRTW